MKIKENEKINVYLNLARKLKKLMNKWIKVIPIKIGALGKVPKGMERKQEELETGGMSKDH